MTISFMFEFPFRDWVIPVQKVLFLLYISCEHEPEMGKNSNSYEHCIPFEDLHFLIALDWGFVKHLVRIELLRKFLFSYRSLAHKSNTTLLLNICFPC